MVSGDWFLRSGFWEVVSVISGFWRLVSGEWFLGSCFWEVVSGISGFWDKWFLGYVVSGKWFLG